MTRIAARRLAATAAVLALLLPAGAAAEPASDPAADERPVVEPRPGELLHLRSPALAETEGGSLIRLPPGYFLAEPTWDVLDAEVRRLQDAETRLGAENASLRASASAGAPWGRGTLAAVLGALAAGAAGGYWLAR